MFSATQPSTPASKPFSPDNLICSNLLQFKETAERSNLCFIYSNNNLPRPSQTLLQPKVPRLVLRGSFRNPLLDLLAV